MRNIAQYPATPEEAIRAIMDQVDRLNEENLKDMRFGDHRAYFLQTAATFIAEHPDLFRAHAAKNV